MKYTILALLLIGCAGASEDQPLKCKSSIVTTDTGDRRLLVQCNRDVQNPPAECEVEGNGAYLCNTYHAEQAFCDTFAGVCDGA